MRIAGRKPMAALGHALRWSDERIPPGLRSVVGVAAAVGGLFGFLPVLGFWMLPLGLALIALDVPGLRRRLLRWVQRKERREAGAGDPANH